MALQSKLQAVAEEGKQALFRLQTVTRVGKQLGMHEAMSWPGLKVLAREAARGKTNPSLLFRFHAENNPERTALIQATSPGHRDAEGVRRIYSYREMNETIDRIAVAFHRRGLGRGTSVLLLLKNRIEFLMIQPAQGRIGGTVVPASWRSTVPEIVYLARHSGARAVFFDADIADVIREAPAARRHPPGQLHLRRRHVPGFASFEELIAEAHGEAPDRSEDGTLVMYTSGTTGKPKGARRKVQKEAFAAAMAFIGETPLGLGQVHLVACPLYHATAFGFTGFAFLLGGHRGGDGRLQARALPRAGGAPPRREHRPRPDDDPPPRRARPREDPQVRHLVAQSHFQRRIAPLSGPLAARRWMCSATRSSTFYGATETGLVTLAKPADLRALPRHHRPRRPRQRDPPDRRGGPRVRRREVGELYAKNGMMVEGYDNADDATTSSKMPDGCFSVGDLARRDARGCSTSRAASAT
jgi:fatty-acyl-CoA synthase